MIFSNKTAQNFIQLISIVLCLSISFTQVTAYGQGIVNANYVDSNVSLVTNQHNLSIPVSLGSVQDSYHQGQEYTSESPLILHIQDAHANVSAQKNISKLIRYAKEQHNVNLIFVEGAYSNLDAQYLEWSDNPQLNKKVGNRLLAMGELTGTDLYLLDHGNDVEVMGIENKELYSANIQLFREIYQNQKEVSSWLIKKEQSIDRDLTRISDKDLLLLLRLLLTFETNQFNLLQAANQLDVFSKKYLKNDFSSYKQQIQFPNLVRLLKLKNEEKQLNIDLAKKDWDALKSSITQKNQTDLIDSIEGILFYAAASQSPKEQDVREVANLRFLLEKLYVDLNQGNEFHFTEYKDLSRLARNMIFQSELDAEKLFLELNQWIQMIIYAMQPSVESQQMVDVVKQFQLLRKLLKLKLTRKDWMKYQASNEKFFDEDDLFIREVIQKANDFYEGAVKREEAFLNNINTYLKEKQKNKAVVILGGFHSQGLIEGYEGNKWSYHMIAPRISSENLFDENNNYVKTVLGRNSSDLYSSQISSVHWAVSKSQASSLQVNVEGRSALSRAVMQEEERILFKADSLGKSNIEAFDEAVELLEASFNETDREKLYKVLRELINRANSKKSYRTIEQLMDRIGLEEYRGSSLNRFIVELKKIDVIDIYETGVDLSQHQVSWAFLVNDLARAYQDDRAEELLSFSGQIDSVVGADSRIDLISSRSGDSLADSREDTPPSEGDKGKKQSSDLSFKMEHVNAVNVRGMLRQQLKDKITELEQKEVSKDGDYRVRPRNIQKIEGLIGNISGKLTERILDQKVQNVLVKINKLKARRVGTQSSIEKIPEGELVVSGEEAEEARKTAEEARARDDVINRVVREIIQEKIDVRKPVLSKKKKKKESRREKRKKKRSGAKNSTTTNPPAQPVVEADVDQIQSKWVWLLRLLGIKPFKQWNVWDWATLVVGSIILLNLFLTRGEAPSDVNGMPNQNKGESSSGSNPQPARNQVTGVVLLAFMGEPDVYDARSLVQYYGKDAANHTRIVNGSNNDVMILAPPPLYGAAFDYLFQLERRYYGDSDFDEVFERHETEMHAYFDSMNGYVPTATTTAWMEANLHLIPELMRAESADAAFNRFYTDVSLSGLDSSYGFYLMFRMLGMHLNARPIIQQYSYTLMRKKLKQKFLRSVLITRLMEGRMNDFYRLLRENVINDLEIADLESQERMIEIRRVISEQGPGRLITTMDRLNADGIYELEAAGNVVSLVLEPVTNNSTPPDSDQNLNSFRVGIYDKWKSPGQLSQSDLNRYFFGEIFMENIVRDYQLSRSVKKRISVAIVEAMGRRSGVESDPFQFYMNSLRDALVNNSENPWRAYLQEVREYYELKRRSRLNPVEATRLILLSTRIGGRRVIDFFSRTTFNWLDDSSVLTDEDKALLRPTIAGGRSLGEENRAEEIAFPELIEEQLDGYGVNVNFKQLTHLANLSQRSVEGVIPVAFEVTERIFSPYDGSLVGELLGMLIQADEDSERFKQLNSVSNQEINLFQDFLRARFINAELPQEPAVFVITESLLKDRDRNMRAMTSILREGDRLIVIDDSQTAFNPVQQMRNTVKGKKVIVKGMRDRIFPSQLRLGVRGYVRGIGLESIADGEEFTPTENRVLDQFVWDEKILQKYQLKPEYVLSALRLLMAIQDPIGKQRIASQLGLDRLQNGKYKMNDLFGQQMQLFVTKFQSSELIATMA